MPAINGYKMKIAIIDYNMGNLFSVQRALSFIGIESITTCNREKILSADPAVANVINNTKVRASQVDVRVDYARTARYGVDPAEVMATLQASRLGVEAMRIIRQKEDVAVLVQLDLKDRPGPDAVRRLPVIVPGGKIVPLQRLADVRIRHIPAAVTRLNGQREITLIAEVDGSIPAAVSRLGRQFQSMALPEGYSIIFAGQYRVLIRTALEMLFAAGAAVILIYFIMVMQFGSWRQPLVILTTIPLALTGALIALFITGQGLDVSVGMGAVTLVGIAVNNGIVLIDYANREKTVGGMDRALLRAASVRLRPILLTTLTTIAALVPTAIGTTVGSRIFQPFAVTVIGGLVSSVCATLIVIPSLAATGGKPGAPGRVKTDPEGDTV